MLVLCVVRCFGVPFPSRACCCCWLSQISAASNLFFLWQLTLHFENCSLARGWFAFDIVRAVSLEHFDPLSVFADDETPLRLRNGRGCSWELGHTCIQFRYRLLLKVTDRCRTGAPKKSAPFSAVVDGHQIYSLWGQLTLHLQPSSVKIGWSSFPCTSLTWVLMSSELGFFESWKSSNYFSVGLTVADNALAQLSKTGFLDEPFCVCTDTLATLPNIQIFSLLLLTGAPLHLQARTLWQASEVLLALQRAQRCRSVIQRVHSAALCWPFRVVMCKGCPSWPGACASPSCARARDRDMFG